MASGFSIGAAAEKTSKLEPVSQFGGRVVSGATGTSRSEHGKVALCTLLWIAREASRSIWGFSVRRLNCSPSRVRSLRDTPAEKFRLVPHMSCKACILNRERTKLILVPPRPLRVRKNYWRTGRSAFLWLHHTTSALPNDALTRAVNGRASPSKCE